MVRYAPLPCLASPVSSIRHSFPFAYLFHLSFPSSSLSLFDSYLLSSNFFILYLPTLYLLLLASTFLLILFPLTIFLTPTSHRLRYPSCRGEEEISGAEGVHEQDPYGQRAVQATIEDS
jgi:hypothetical protein